MSETSKRIIIAIDGPAGSGKSTVARRVASRLGFVYIDSGAMYRAVALEAIRERLDLNDTMSIEDIARQVRIEFLPGSVDILVNGENATEAIRRPAVSAAASIVAAIPEVRKALVEHQRAMAAHCSLVMEGRDIGTVVFPDADVKIFLDAHSQVRSERRTRELSGQGAEVEGDRVAREMEERDSRDRTRRDSPLLQAPDAIYLDSTGLSLDQVEEAILGLIRRKTSNGKEAAH